MNTETMQTVLVTAQASAATALGGVTEIDKMSISRLSACGFASVAYSVISEMASRAPVSYAWALRSLAGAIRKTAEGQGCK